MDQRTTVDPLSGEVHADPRSADSSPADQAALEVALTLGQEWGWAVIALTAGPADADGALRQALAAGANRGIRVDVALDRPSDVVAAALASAMPADVGLVCCGAWSVDRGSGSVPAFLAARLGTAQALGLLSVGHSAGNTTAVTAERRLDGGRRERLAVRIPAVISVEAGTTRLRRAPLEGIRRANHATIDVVVPIGDDSTSASFTVAPYRPRAKTLPGPRGPTARQRVLELTGASSDRPTVQVLTLSPDAAADAVVEQLRAWRYLT